MFVEPDTLQNADPREVEAELFTATTPSEPPPEPLRFSLAQLLIGTTITAVLLALFRALGIWGAVLSFGAALIFTLLIYPQARPGRKQQQALMFDFVWGIVMPVVCLVFDPFVFKLDEGWDPGFVAGPFQWTRWPRFNDLAFVAYPVLACQLAIILSVLVIGRPGGTWAAAAAGSLVAGMIVSTVIGVALFPMATLGLMLLIGILGYTPLFTAFSYGRRAREMWRQATSRMSRQRALAIALLGALLAAAIPAGLGFVALQLKRGADLIREASPAVDSVMTEGLLLF